MPFLGNSKGSVCERGKSEEGGGCWGEYGPSNVMFGGVPGTGENVGLGVLLGGGCT